MGCGGSKPQPKAAPAPAPAAQPKKPVEYNPDAIFKVTLEKKEGDKLGATVLSPDDLVLMISAMAGSGLVVSWNAENENKTELQLQVGDIIVQVNEAKGNNIKMIENLKKPGTIVLSVVKPTKDEPPVKPQEEPGAEPPAADPDAADAPKEGEAAAQAADAPKEGEAAAQEESKEEPEPQAGLNAMADVTPEQVDDTIVPVADKTDTSTDQTKSCSCF